MSLSSMTQQQIAQLPATQRQAIYEAIAASSFPPTTVTTLADLDKFMDQHVKVTFFGQAQTLPLKRAYHLLRLTSDATLQQKPKPEAIKPDPTPASISVSLIAPKVGAKRSREEPMPKRSNEPTPAAKKQRTQPPKSSRVSKSSASSTNGSGVVAAAGPTKQDTKVAAVEYGRKMFTTTPPEPLKATISDGTNNYYFKNFAVGSKRADDLKEFGKHGCKHQFYEKIFPAKPVIVQFCKNAKLVLRPKAVKDNPNLKFDLMGRLDNTTLTLQPIPNMNKELTNPSSIWCPEMVTALGSHTSMCAKPSKNGWDKPIYYPEAFLAEVTLDVARLLHSVGVRPKKYFRMPAGFSFGAGRELLIHLHKGNADVFKKLNEDYGTDDLIQGSTTPISNRASYASSSSSYSSSSSEDDDVVEVKKPAAYKNVPVAQRDRHVSANNNRPKTITLPNTRVANTTQASTNNTISLNRSNSNGLGAQGFRRIKTDDDDLVPDQNELQAAASIIEQEMEEARRREEQEAFENGREYHFTANGTEVEAM